MSYLAIDYRQALEAGDGQILGARTGANGALLMEIESAGKVPIGGGCGSGWRGSGHLFVTSFALRTLTLVTNI
jgi:hypothetical protein